MLTLRVVSNISLVMKTFSLINNTTKQEAQITAATFADAVKQFTGFVVDSPWRRVRGINFYMAGNDQIYVTQVS